MEISPNLEMKPRVRRRLIQSTLFPHKPQNDVVCLDEDVIIEANVDQEHDEDDCRSQKKLKRRKAKGAASQSRASRKVAVSGNEIGEKKIEEEDSPATVKVDFFVKVSERRHQRKQQKEQLSFHSPEKVEQICSPPDVITNSKSPGKPRKRASSTPKKRQASVTPEKRQMNSTRATNGTLNEDHLDKMLASPPKPLPDLRLEAKLSAEENSRIFAGKQVHPFFSSWKTSKKNSESTGTANKCFYAERNESNTDFSPVHIFEDVQGETFSVDWRNWPFSESISTRAGRDPEDVCLQLINEGSVKCLQFDNFHDVLSPEISPCQNSEVREIGKIGGLSANSEFVVNPDSQLQGTLLAERTTSSYQDCSYQPKNSLWTTKYQPERATEICGNCDSVKFLSEWLQQWHEKGLKTNKCSTDNDNWIMEDVDLNYCPSDCDSDCADEGTDLKNVLLVTGPVGSGKSAAIYACAKELGFQVIEVNTSDWRNGALVKQKFGEAVESHWLKRSMPNIKNPDSKSQLKSPSTTCNVEDVQRSANDVIELIPLSDDEDSDNVGGLVVKPISSQNGTKTLILFEDVDASLYEDRGFLTTIQQLAETAKRPMILTSNSDDPDLPNNLDRIEVNFTIPSSKELLNLMYMVCKAEKAEIEPCLAERFIDYCQGDIRKTIMLLQFWCQGQKQKKDSEVRNKYAPLVFDTDAGHHVLPQMIPSGYTSKLSEMIENEITKSVLLTEKDVSFMEIIEEEEEVELNDTHGIEAKKDEMLRRHCYDQDGNDFCVTTNELPSISNSPAPFTRRTLQKKYDTVMSSDSGQGWSEELFDINEDVSAQIAVETKKLRRKYNAILSSDSEEDCFVDGLCPPNGLSVHTASDYVEENLEDTCHPSEVPCDSKINGICKSEDVSCVPESSYVAETEMENGTVMYSTMCSSQHVDPRIDESPLNTDCVTTTTAEDKVPVVMVKHLHLDTVEEIGDSHIEPTEAMPREYQMMDECSRIDFSRRAESIHGSESVGSTDIVQETWRKLRNCSKEYSQYVSTEENDTSEALGLAFGMTNLISEADILLANCQSLTCDYLKPSMVSNEKSHSYSWHDDQLQMASTFAQHGFCLYAKRSVASVANGRVDLAWEMLAASTNAISLGKLISRDYGKVKTLVNKKPQGAVFSRSMLESPVCNTVQSIVPLRSQLSLKGYVFHEYLSSLAQISKSESSRLSEAVNQTNKRRKRVARNYLSTGALSLSSEDILLLDKYSCHQEQSPETKTEISDL
uniref:uncharacterized protein LOC122598097 n=1 Tax=Erigeron canadensis TaxID=72917 RepID=UPI001CB96155|nr:uncharacterized protein LOC122598097 [Erigeron canadensis]